MNRQCTLTHLLISLNTHHSKKQEFFPSNFGVSNILYKSKGYAYILQLKLDFEEKTWIDNTPWLCVESNFRKFRELPRKFLNVRISVFDTNAIILFFKWTIWKMYLKI